MGNTCYLNSAPSSAPRNSLPRVFHTSRPVNPKALVQSFFKVADQRDQGDEFHFGAQADGTEAVLFILQVLHEQQARRVVMEINGVPKSP